jgi:glycosyltransferase involved in cell wall biosynthesis
MRVSAVVTVQSIAKQALSARTHHMRVLVLTTKYNAADKGPYLSNELAHELARHGHRVQVVSLEWDHLANVERWSEGPAIDVLRIPSGPSGSTLARLKKWIGSSIRARRIAAQALADTRYDLVIVFSPATAKHALLSWAQARADKSVYYITDFFPFHHRALGLIGPYPVFAMARLFERMLVRRFDTIGCMSPAGIAYLQGHYPLRPSQRLIIVPPWGGPFARLEVQRDLERRRRWLPRDQPILLFGGQIVEGRGIETILAAAGIAQQRQLAVVFALIGSGRLVPLVKQAIDEGITTLRLLLPEARDDYLKLAAACDVGLVVTVADVDVPTFPSKTIDYLRVGLPILAAVETSTDYGSVIESWGVGKAIPAGAPAALLDAAMTMLSDLPQLARMRERGPKVADTHLSVQSAARSIAAAAGFAPFES